jgi:hypothetical protein
MTDDYWDDDGGDYLDAEALASGYIVEDWTWVRERGRPRKAPVACSVPGCSRDAKAKGLCWRCYKRRQRSVQE